MPPKTSVLSQKYQLKSWLFTIGAIIFFGLLFLISSLSMLRVFLPYYGDLAGFPFSQKNYLIIFQNNSELRPAGGFISAFAIAKFRGGSLTEFNIEDVYGDIDEHGYIKPPYPMAELLAGENYQGYTFRDANYSPDFAVTSEELIKMLHLTRPDTTIDGVIAINYSFLEDLLGVIGSMNVDGKTYHAENLFENLEYEVNNIDRHNVESLQNRKNVLKSLYSSLKNKIFWNPFIYRKVSDQIVQAINTKEIQLYFKSSSLTKLTRLQGWEHTWPKQIQGDFLAMIEANLGGMKSDRYLQRIVNYKVIFEEDQKKKLHPIAEVTVTIRHNGIENIPLSGSYKGFFRLYVPKGVKLLDVNTKYQKNLYQTEENQFQVFGNIVKLQPGESTQIIYRYVLPESVLKDGHYSLFIPKQSGTEADIYSAIVELPQGFNMKSKTLHPKENIGFSQNILVDDLMLDFTLLPDKLPPVIIYQNIDRYNEITVVFNENITRDIQLQNIEIQDLNFQNSRTDHITVKKLDIDGKILKIFIEGMTRQQEEHYRIKLKNISDLHQNMIEPNPKEITVVQRF